MRTLSLMLAAALAASVAAPGGENLSPEALLPQHEKTHAHEPAAAFGGDVFLVVWRAGMNENADLVGLRLDKTGKPLDAKPIVISNAKDEQSRPRLAFDGTNFLVVWQDLRNEKDYDVYAARVSPQGKVLDTDGISVASGEKNQCEPAVCSDGKGFQVLWRDVRNGGKYEIFGGRISPDGRLLDGNGVLIQKPSQLRGARTWGTPGVLAAPNDILLAGARGSGMLQLWHMRDGKAQGPVVLVPGQKFNGEPMFASDGKKVLVVWTTLMIGGGRSTGMWDSGMLLVDPKAPLASQKIKRWDYTANPKSLATTNLAGKGRKHVRHPSPAWDGKSYVVAWDLECMDGQKLRYDAVFLRRISASGEGLGNDQRIAGELASPAFRPAVASDGKGTTLILYERHPKTADVPIKIAFRTLRAK